MSFFSVFSNKFNKFNNTVARMSDLVYHNDTKICWCDLLCAQSCCVGHCIILLNLKC